MVVRSRRVRWHNSSSKPRTPLSGQPIGDAFSCDCLGKRHQNSAPINRVSCFDGRHEQRPYSLGCIVMPLVHKRGFLLLNPKLTRHLGRTLRPNRIEHANTLAGLGQSYVHRLAATSKARCSMNQYKTAEELLTRHYDDAKTIKANYSRKPN